MYSSSIASNGPHPTEGLRLSEDRFVLQQLLDPLQVLVALDALVLAHAVVRPQPESLLDPPWLREDLRVLHDGFVQNRVVGVARVALGHPQLFRVDRADADQPALVVEAAD